MAWFAEFGADTVAAALSLAMIAAYYAFLWQRARRHPTYTIHAVNQLARSLWVESVMAQSGKDVMAVQTLRNYVMGAVFMGSTATLLIIGTLTLSGQAENIARSWHVLNAFGSHAPELWIVKVLTLLAAFIVAFFAFAMSIRLMNHVLFMINAQGSGAHPALSAERVAGRLNRAGHFYAMGMRAFFGAVPLVFWLFGPLLLVAATAGLVYTLHRLDRCDD